ncbi:MAG TPA: hypothetical protein DCM28_03460 [Phycisphaerales bacterium]|nr:hypothetical protein [Phycisphaerales bacterium]
MEKIVIYPKNGIPRIRIRFGPDAPEPQTPRQMIESTNRYLSFMLNGKRRIPRIPRRRVDQGGFDWIRNRPGAKALAEHFWNRLLGR